MIDICDFAVGLSRQLYGLTIASERPGHRMIEPWHPLGPVGVITAFNFPVAVWGWNAALALVCGDPVVWKPSERTPLTAIATTSLLARAAERHGDVPDGLFSSSSAGPTALSSWPRTRASRSSPRPARPRWARRRRGRRGPPRPLAARARRQQRRDRRSERRSRSRRARGFFAAVGTAGQRCTRLRRLIVHESVADELLERLVRPTAASRSAIRGSRTRSWARSSRRGVRTDGGRDRRGGAQGGEVVDGGGARWPIAGPAAGTPSPRSSDAGTERRRQAGDVRADSVRPRYDDLDEAIALQNGVPQGSRRRSSRPTCARPSNSSPRRAPTAGSPTSTSGRAAPRSAARSAARRRPAAVASRGPTRGEPTCAARPQR